VLAEFMVTWRWEDTTAKQLLKADPGNAAGYILVPKTSMLLLASLIILQISNSNLCPDVLYKSQQLERMKTRCRCCTTLAFVKFIFATAICVPLDGYCRMKRLQK
jgi:hypothetical protein